MWLDTFPCNLKLISSTLFVNSQMVQLPTVRGNNPFATCGIISFCFLDPFTPSVNDGV